MAEGHRKRLREDYMKSGLNGFSDLHLLELLLTYCIPRVDTNPLAHALLDRFGSLKGVFSASVNELQQIEGIGESTAVFLNMLPEVWRRSERFESEKLLSSEDVRCYVLSRMRNLPDERFYLICLRHDGSVCYSAYVEEGSAGSVNVNTRKIARLALGANAALVIVAHNHPSGAAQPSEADRSVTQALRKALYEIDIELADHIIVAGEDTYSFAEHGFS